MFTRSITRLTLALIIVVASLLLVTSFTVTAAAPTDDARPLADLIVNPGESIQAAIDAANAGDTIIVNAGDYTESLTLSKPVSLTGVNSNIIYIDANASGPTHDGTSWASAYITLQAGLDVAVSGDELWVADGVYTPTLERSSGSTRTVAFVLKPGVALYGGFGGEGVSETLRSQRDWTIHRSILSGDLDNNDLNTDGNSIDETWQDIVGENAYHIVICSGVTETTVLDGFTITAADATPNIPGGGSFYNEASSPTLANITFSGNSATSGGAMLNISNSRPTLTNVVIHGNIAVFGGGMYNLAGSAPTLISVTFSSNMADGYGAGMQNSNSSPALNHVVFSRNVVYDRGGGISNEANSNPTLNHVIFNGNVAYYSGAGMFNVQSHPILTDVVFSDNWADYSGGGMDNESASPTLTNVIFNGNQAGAHGGGMENFGSNPLLINVVFSGNRVDDRPSPWDVYGGGAMRNYSSNPILINVTVSGNYANQYGGGLHNRVGSHPFLINSIVWGNNAGISGPEISNTLDSTPTIAYSDVQWPEGVYSGTNNLNADPLFIAPITATAAPTTTGNYRLLATSPVVDAGNNFSNTIVTDLDGRPRILGSTIDVGAYEFAGSTRYVATTGDDASNLCLDQLSPCSTVQHAIDVASENDELRIASGTYTDMSVRPRNDITTTGVVTQVAYLSKTLTIRGGYTLTNWLTPDLSINQTILDAQAKGRVFYITGNISPTIEGLRLTNGTGILSDNYCEPFICYIPGGAIYAVNATVELIDSIVDNNAGGYEGAAIFVANGHASLSNNVVMSNTAGGATLFNSDGLIKDNRIIGNTAGNGGGILTLSGTATLLHNDILSNTAGYACGGGVCVAYGSTAALNNNVIRGNTASASVGGGVGVFHAQAVLRNNLIEGNFVNSPRGYSSGGGVSVDATGHAELIENTIRNNVVSGSIWARGGGASVDGNSSVTMTGNLIENNAASQGGGLSVARLSNSVVANNLFVNNVGGSEIHLAGGEARLLHNTLAGNASSSSLYVTTYSDSQTPAIFSTIALTNTIIASYTTGIHITAGNTATLNSLLWYSTPVTISSAISASVSTQNDVYGDPRFVDPAHDDYHLAFGSAAIDRGIDAGVYIDLDGNPRPIGSGFDIGAYEYQSPLYRVFLPGLRR